MTKILLVEDDNSLREIYSMRLAAEGYEMVQAENGEAGLAQAVAQLPDLIISDAMMPKMSGFEMLDLLKGNDKTRNIRVIMMTALSADGQKERGEKLGADRYLVKSQVGIEDLVHVVHEILGDQAPAVATNNNSSSMPTQPQYQTPQPTIQPTVVPVAQLNPMSSTPVGQIVPESPITAPVAPMEPATNLPPVLTTAPEQTQQLPPIPAPIQPAAQVFANPNGADPLANVSNIPPAAVEPQVPSFQPNFNTEDENYTAPREPATSPDLTQSAGGMSRVIAPPTADATLNPRINIDDLLAKEDVSAMGLNPVSIQSSNPELAQPSPVGPQLDEADAFTQLNSANVVPDVSANDTLKFN
jgi:CheY-like chemotaxis protein